MRTTIDKGGRVVIPKDVRDAMGLTPGTKVDIVFTDGRIEIQPAPVQLELTTIDGVPVIRSLEDLPPADTESARRTVERIRAERDARHV